MPTGVLMPVASMSILAFMGMVKELETPGMVRASFISSFSFSTVMPGRHCGLGLQVDHGLEHLEGRGVGRRLRPARLAEDARHLRYALQDLVLQSEGGPWQPIWTRQARSRACRRGCLRTGAA